MVSQKRRLLSIGLVILLFSGLIPFGLFNPPPKVYAPDLELQTIQIATSYDTHIRLLAPAAYLKFPVNSLQLSQICVTGCAPDSWMRAAARFPLAAIPDNATVVYVGFNYTGIRNGAADPKPYIVSLDIEPSAASAEDLYNNITTDRIYYDNPDGTFPIVAALQEIELNLLARLDLMGALSGGDTYFSLGFRNDTEVGADGTTIIESLEVPVGGDPPTLTVQYYAGPVCISESFEIENPSALAEDGTPWVYTESKFYSFNASYSSFNLTASDEASIRFSPDEVTNVTLTFTWNNNITGRISNVDSADFITTTSSPRNGVGFNLNQTSGDLWVIFPVWFTNNSPDAQNVDVYSGCSGVGFLDSGEDFHIYNRGGLIEKPPPTGNASFTEGGEWFEVCAFNSSFVNVNMTWRKLQHFRVEYALRFYENVSGVWVPEDQFMQTQQHSGGGAEKYGVVNDWILRWKIFAYDNSSGTWVRLIQVSMWMGDGDEGADDEWIAVATQITDHNDVDLDTRFWNAFIEEEPAARFRTWQDIWINKVNASSVIGSRSNAYFFGMERESYLRWQPFFLVGADTWSPMLDNQTEVIRFLPMEFNDNSTAFASEIDLMKIEFELDFFDGGASDPYRVCIEDVNVNEVLVKDGSSFLDGINTPIFIESKVPDMPIGGLLGGLWQAITSLGKTIVEALSGVLGLVWDAIQSQFPWAAQFIEDLYTFASSFIELSATIITSMVTLLDFIASQFSFFGVIVGAIGDTWDMLTSWLDPFTANAGDWVLLLLIVFGFLPFADALHRGDSAQVRADLEMVWGFLSTVLDWGIRLGKAAIDIVLGFIPG